MNVDVAIIGAGLGGLLLALSLAASGKVALICKRGLPDGASNWAQRGIAAVLDSGGSTASHLADTLEAGAGLCDEDVSRYIVEHGRAAIDCLIEQGVPFTHDAAAELGYHLTRESGHSARRIIHAADATGHAVQATLEQKVRSHPNITLLEQHIALDLVTTLGTGGRCAGVYVQDVRHGRVVTIAAGHTVLATGGAGSVYLYTTNRPPRPETASP